MCYLTPLLGGYIADVYQARYQTILFFASIYLVGLVQAVIGAIPGNSYPALVFFALYTIALGTGGIKPNVSTLGADQFDDRVESERQQKESYFSWFYFSVNLGAFFAYTIVSYICQFGLGGDHGGEEWGDFFMDTSYPAALWLREFSCLSPVTIFLAMKMQKKSV